LLVQETVQARQLGFGTAVLDLQRLHTEVVQLRDFRADLLRAAGEREELQEQAEVHRIALVGSRGQQD
jgi:hypothetical protein